MEILLLLSWISLLVDIATVCHPVRYSMNGNNVIQQNDSFPATYASVRKKNTNGANAIGSSSKDSRLKTLRSLCFFSSIQSETHFWDVIRLEASLDPQDKEPLFIVLQLFSDCFLSVCYVEKHIRQGPT